MEFVEDHIDSKGCVVFNIVSLIAGCWVTLRSVHIVMHDRLIRNTTLYLNGLVTIEPVSEKRDKPVLIQDFKVLGMMAKLKE